MNASIQYMTNKNWLPLMHGALHYCWITTDPLITFLSKYRNNSADDGRFQRDLVCALLLRSGFYFYLFELQEAEKPILVINGLTTQGMGWSARRFIQLPSESLWIEWGLNCDHLCNPWPLYHDWPYFAWEKIQLLFLLVFWTSFAIIL